MRSYGKNLEHIRESESRGMKLVKFYGGHGFTYFVVKKRKIEVMFVNKKGKIVHQFTRRKSKKSDSTKRLTFRSTK